MDEAQPDVGAPDSSEMAQIEMELADVDVVLACLDRGVPTRCEVCEAATADGSIASRAALRLCSFNREPTDHEPGDEQGDEPADEQLSPAAAPPTMPATELAGDGGRRGTV